MVWGKQTNNPCNIINITVSLWTDPQVVKGYADDLLNPSLKRIEIDEIRRKSVLYYPYAST